MDEFGCDYECRTVGESILKYNIPDDWCADFDAYDDTYPIICIEVEKIRKNSALMDQLSELLKTGYRKISIQAGSPVSFSFFPLYTKHPSFA